MADNFNISDGAPVSLTDSDFTESDGFVQIGELVIQWGNRTSTIDGAEVFSYDQAFATAVMSVWVQRTGAGPTRPLPVTAKTASGFTIDRANLIDGNAPFKYVAIGH